MQQRDLLLKLAKLVIAAAWTDGELDQSEINVLKDMVISFDELHEGDWEMLDMYMEIPVSEPEAVELMQDLVDSVCSDADKAIVMAKLRELVEADGIVTDSEERLLEEVQACLDSKKVGMLTFLKGITGLGREKRDTQYNREDRADDYVKNRVYFNLMTAHGKNDAINHLAEPDLRSLCLYASLFAFVAKSDEVISDDEKAAISKIIEEAYHISPDLAPLVCEASLNLVENNTDKFEITRNVYQKTSYPERVTLVKVLFQIANACEATSNDEINEISQIADLLRLQRPDFIAAKLCIAKEDRKGL